MGRRIALLIGANSYADPHLRGLRSPVSDLQSLARVLGSAAIGGFEVRQILDVPAHQVNAEIEELFADRSREDVLLAYFSCHGIKDDSGRLYFAASNTRLNRLGSTAVSASFVHDQLEQSSSRQIVVLLDCCYSGAFANSEGLTPRSDRHVDVNERLAGTGRAIITATTAMEYAFEPQGLESVGAPGSSLFTRALVAGLESGDADLNKDGVVTVDELYSYVYDELREATPRQTPRKQFSLSGDLVIAKNPRPVVPEALPDSVRLAIESPLAGVRREGIVALRQLVLSNGSYGRIARDPLETECRRQPIGRLAGLRDAAGTAVPGTGFRPAAPRPTRPRHPPGQARPGQPVPAYVAPTDHRPVPRPLAAGTCRSRDERDQRRRNRRLGGGVRGSRAAVAPGPRAVGRRPLPRGAHDGDRRVHGRPVRQYRHHRSHLLGSQVRRRTDPEG
jgi:Caspase domain